MTTGPLHALVGSPAWSGALEAELAPSRLDGPRWPGVLTSRAPLACDPVFARQQLPAATLVKGTTPSDLATSAAALAQVVLAGHAGPATLLVGAPDPTAYRTLSGHVRELASRLDAALRAGPGRSGGVAAWQRREDLGRGTLVIQALVVARTSVLVSAVTPRPLPHGGFDLAPWPAGNAPVRDDRSAPSRAYRKLREGFAWLGATPAPGDVCVDLGGAPGGWAHTALSAGARVLSVDRSALDDRVRRMPGFSEARGDAFGYEPPTPVDWLLCDVICEPRRTILLVERWMSRGWCRRVVATLKFKGPDYGALEEARRRLERIDWPFLRIKHLHFHNNEAAILASR
jgi:23S rRNA C2498 (ribose-2'-O)-methylase RlmM